MMYRSSLLLVLCLLLLVSCDKDCDCISDTTEETIVEEFICEINCDIIGNWHKYNGYIDDTGNLIPYGVTSSLKEKEIHIIQIKAFLENDRSRLNIGGEFFYRFTEECELLIPRSIYEGYFDMRENCEDFEFIPLYTDQAINVSIYYSEKIEDNLRDFSAPLGLTAGLLIRL